MPYHWYLHLTGQITDVGHLCILEDCIALERKIPDFYNCFVNGGFMVTQTLRRGSSMPMDQALKKQYNKPAKGPSGVIGFSRKKAAVCKWNLIKHKKYLYTDSFEKICGLKSDDEYSLNHEFSQSITEVDRTKKVQKKEEKL